MICAELILLTFLLTDGTHATSLGAREEWRVGEEGRRLPELLPVYPSLINDGSTTNCETSPVNLRHDRGCEQPCFDDFNIGIDERSLDGR